MIETTKLSSKGQVIIPKVFRSAHHWEAGLELIVIDTEDGILLKPKTPFEVSTLNEAAGCLQSLGATKQPEDIEARIRQKLREEWGGSN